MQPSARRHRGDRGAPGWSELLGAAPAGAPARRCRARRGDRASCRWMQSCGRTHRRARRRTVAHARARRGSARSGRAPRSRADRAWSAASERRSAGSRRRTGTRQAGSTRRRSQSGGPPAAGPSPPRPASQTSSELVRVWRPWLPVQRSVTRGRPAVNGPGPRKVALATLEPRNFLVAWEFLPRRDDSRTGFPQRMIGERRRPWKLPHSLIQPALPAFTDARRSCGFSPTSA